MRQKKSSLKKKLDKKYRWIGIDPKDVAFFIGIALGVAAAVFAVFGIVKLVRSGVIKLPVKTETAETNVEEDSVTTASVIAVGDNLYHMSMINAGANENGPWNYDFLYEHVLDEIQAADLAIVDQETVLTKDHDAVEAYPKFMTPVEAADALAKAGFDVVYSATNHADDEGPDPIRETVSYWRTNYPEITLVGLHDSAEDAAELRIREVNGIKIAFLNYTYGTNMAVSEGIEDYMIDEFSQGSQYVARMIQKAKAQADCVIFIAHWGIEDDTLPSEYQKQWAGFLMRQGVDVVIGGHPHVLQPYGRVQDNQGHDMVLFYSLGNFVSNMNFLNEVIEGMASFTIEKTVKDGQTSIRILDETVKPMIMHYDRERKNPAVYMLDDYTEELAAEHGTSQYSGEVTLEIIRSRFDEIVNAGVETSPAIDLLDKHFDWDGNMY